MRDAHLEPAGHGLRIVAGSAMETPARNQAICGFDGVRDAEFEVLVDVDRVVDIEDNEDTASIPYPSSKTAHFAIDLPYLSLPCVFVRRTSASFVATVKPGNDDGEMARVCC